MSEASDQLGLVAEVLRLSEALAASQRREQELRQLLDQEREIVGNLAENNIEIQARLDAAEALVVKWRKMTFGLGTQMSCADDLEKCLTQVSANGEAAG